MNERNSASRTVVIGRAAGCDLLVNDPSISTRHCRLTATPQGFVLEDLGSTNGTYVNGVRVVRPTLVQRHDRITLGPQCNMPWPVWASAPPPLPGRPAQAPPAAQVVRIGRAADNDVVLDHPSVSANHARVIIQDGRLIVEDLGSTNGVAVGRAQNRVSRAAISAGDMIYFGAVPVPASRILNESPQSNSSSSAAIALEAKTIVFGRDPECDQVLDVPSVSWRHACITHAGGSLLLKDLGSTNGTFLNGERVIAPQAVKPGDVIHLGTFTLSLTGKGTLEKKDDHGNVTIEARNLGVDVPGRRLLDSVSLTVFPTEFVGLMGPSGAGKTTLMNALNGYTRPSKGQVLLNGHDLYASYAQFASYLGYVPQDDIIHRELTVGEALYYTARLRLPDYREPEIRSRIREVLQSLDLMPTENVLIGSAEKKGISGGQRKRVNLAMELLTDPLVLFLDEPTSGLSSEDALLVMRLLRRLADSGKTILLTVHQPSLEAYRLMDNLILVSKDKGSGDPGRLVYYGPAHPAAAHFFNPNDSNPNPIPDEIFKGLSQRPSAEWAGLYQQSKYHRQFVAERARRSGEAPHMPSSTRGPTIWQMIGQWRTQAARCLTIKRKDVWNTLILAAQAPVVAILLVLVFGDQTSQSATERTLFEWQKLTQSVGMTVFLMTLAAIWFGCSNSAREIVGEWPIYHRERMINLFIPSYIASKLTVLGGLCLLQCAVLLGITYWGCSLKGPVVSLFFVLVLSSFVGVAIGLTLSAVARTSEVAIGLLPIVLLPMIILGGALRPVNRLPVGVQALCYVIPSRWAFESALLLEAKKQPRYFKDPAPGQLPNQPRPAATGDEDEATADFAEDFFPSDKKRYGVPVSLAVLGALGIATVVGVHEILRFRDVHRAGLFKRK
jgi:ABC-type multidrug transport system ATPase subunit